MWLKLGRQEHASILAFDFINAVSLFYNTRSDVVAYTTIILTTGLHVADRVALAKTMTAKEIAPC
jgi:hypothetical protein